MSRIIPQDDEFLTACRDGDIDKVQSMLQSGEGRPGDVTPDGDTPLKVSAKMKQHTLRILTAT
jgi:hypothetical protein